MRLIDADELVQVYEELKDRYKDGICCDVLDSIINDINNAPTIEPSGDLISRAEAIEAVQRVVIDKDVVSVLSALPSADRQTDKSCQDCPLYDTENHNCPRFNKVIPQTRKEMLDDRPKGEWIDVEHEPYCECSVCGAYIENLDDDFAFCPRCGADMRGGAE